MAAGRTAAGGRGAAPAHPGCDGTALRLMDVSWVCAGAYQSLVHRAERLPHAPCALQAPRASPATRARHLSPAPEPGTWAVSGGILPPAQQQRGSVHLAGLGPLGRPCWARPPAQSGGPCCRRLRSVDWSLLGCGRSGHVTYAPEPRRDKELRSTLILRIFAIERFLRAVVFAILAYGVWQYRQSRLSIEAAFDRKLPVIRALFRELGFNINHSKLVGLIQRAFTLSPRILDYLVIGLVVYVLIELIEGVGLWLVMRWGEYFAMVATSVFLPYEIYDLTAKITATRVLFFLVNLALVLYLVITKRLFGVRGGKHAYEARLRSESVLQSAIIAAAADAERAAAPDRSVPAGTAASAAAFQAAGAAAAAGNPAPPGAPAAGAPAAENPEPAGTAEAGTARLPRAGQDSDPGDPPGASR